MAKITVVDTKQDLDFIQQNSIIEFKKAPDKFDAYKIEAYFNGNLIGIVGASINMVVPGCETNKDIFESVPDVFQGMVVDNTKSITTTMTKKVLIVELSGVGGAANKTSTKGVKIFTFSISGSSTKYTGKTQVMEDVDNGRKVFLELRKETDENGKELIVAYRQVNGQEEKCGKVDEKKCGTASFSTAEELNLIKSILDTEKIEGIVSTKYPTSYILNIEIANNKISGFKTQAVKKAMGSIKQDLVNQGFDELVLTEIEDYLTLNKFTVSEIQNIFKSYKKYDDSVSYRIIKKPKTQFKDTFGSLKVCYAAFLNNFHLLLSGDKGTGKNCLISTWAWILQRPLYEISINRETDKLDLLGSKTIESEVDSNTGKVLDKIEFQAEVLLEAMEVGGIINIDEINFADPGITGLLHSICDDRREIQVPGYKKVVSDDNFFVMGTMNIDYQGTNELNEALADRFIDIKFPSNESIANILTANCPTATHAEIQICDNIYKQMYVTIQNRDSSLDSNCLTVRGFIQALNMSPILGIKKALEICVADKIKDEEYCNNVKTIISSKAK